MNLILRLSQKIGNSRFWRTMANFWTIVFFAAIAYDFWNENALAKSDIMVAVAAIYCACLAIYSTEKEFRRWHHMHSSIHPGEIYVILWTIFVLALVVAQAYLHLDYRMPAEVSASYVAVISILALTRESKKLYRKKGRR